MLIGVGGSGKQSLAKLAVYMAELIPMTIVISKSYSLNDFKTDLQVNPCTPPMCRSVGRQRVLVLVYGHFNIGRRLCSLVHPFRFRFAFFLCDARDNFPLRQCSQEQESRDRASVSCSRTTRSSKSAFW